ncbi:MAG: cysteine desulfurase [Phycisphaerae bacterium]|jgi:cysteine desulfurase/selenocysteine lyase|nr:cysteine desulfurase [Phycisphaerae bacterium]MBT6164528.1 cysteine desulfurase [Phycisphaerae bacterium]MBT7657116.1 cysteine desulfurase [Phycisphaerae bacterium]
MTTASIVDNFPALRQSIGDKSLVYLDSAATTQKPQSVIDAVTRYYEHDNANIHRGVHTLSQRATQSYENARKNIASLLGANRPEEVIFVRGATEAINMIAQAWARPRLVEGDEILITEMEHHSNIVPWQIVCEQTGAILKVAPVLDDGSLDIEAYKSLLSEDTVLVSIAHVSNAIGTINPVQELCAFAKEAGATTVVDGAQACGHLQVNFQEIDCDFYAVSGHKMFGPTGIGCLLGKYEVLQEMEPWQGGGDMILSVSFEETTWNDVPFKFEAGTPNIAGAIGLGAAVQFIEGIGYETMVSHEQELLAYGRGVLENIEGVTLVGASEHNAGVLSFTVEGVHPHDVGTILDHAGVAIRTGNHCAEPLMRRFGLSATCRASLSVYNTTEDLDRLGLAVQEAIRILG